LPPELLRVTRIRPVYQPARTGGHPGYQPRHQRGGRKTGLMPRLLATPNVRLSPLRPATAPGAVRTKQNDRRDGLAVCDVRGWTGYKFHQQIVQVQRGAKAGGRAAAVRPPAA